VAQCDPGSSWIVSVNTEDVEPVWSITPSASNVNFLDPAGGILVLQVATLISQLATGTSPMFIGYFGIPGCNEGYACILLSKSPPTPYINSFTATSADGTILNEGANVIYKAPVTLSWNIFAAEGVSCAGEAFAPVGSMTVYPSQLLSTYIVEAVTNGQPTGVQSILELNVLPPTVKLSVVMQESNGLVLTWVCTGADECSLTANGVPVANNLPPSGSLQQSPTVATSYVVTAVQSGTQRSASSTIDVIVPSVTCTAVANYWQVHRSRGISPNYWQFSASWTITDADSCSIMLQPEWGPDTVISTSAQGSWSSEAQVGPIVQPQTLTISATSTSGYTVVQVAPWTFVEGEPPKNAAQMKSITERVLSAASGVPLAFAAGNLAAGDPGPVVYISSDASLGKIEITIQNNSGAPVSATTTSTLTIYMMPLLEAADVQNIQVVGTQWTGKAVAQDGRYCYQLSPNETIEISSQIQIELDNVFSSESNPGSGYLTFAYSGLTGTPDSSVRINMLRMNPPSAAAAELSPSFGSRPSYGADDDGAVVYLTVWTPPVGETGIANWILPAITNQSNTTPLPLGTSSQIVVSFLSGNDANCLCTDDQLAALKVSATPSDPDSSWKVGMDNQGVAPVWTFTPDTSNPCFLGAAGGTLAMEFSNLVTELSGSSPVFILYSGIPGYNDGYAFRMLSKSSPVPSLIYFQATEPDGTVVVNGAGVVYKTTLTLSWSVFAAESCLLNGDSQTPTGSLTVQPSAPLSYTLEPMVGNTPAPSYPLQYTILPPVASLSASALVVGGGVPFTLTWNCTGGDNCSLSANGAVSATGLALAGSQTATLMENTTFVITCYQNDIPGGPRTTSSQVQVEVVPVSVVTFTGSDVTDSNAGTRTVTVSWSVEYASGCEVTTAAGDKIGSGLSGEWSRTAYLDRPLHGNLPTQFVLTAIGLSTIVQHLDVD
jgi:hypothetical protein